MLFSFFFLSSFSLSSLASTCFFFPRVPKVAPRFLTKQLVLPLFSQKPTLFPSVPPPSPPGPIGSALSLRAPLTTLRRWRGTPGPHRCCLINSFHHVNQKKEKKNRACVLDFRTLKHTQSERMTNKLSRPRAPVSQEEAKKDRLRGKKKVKEKEKEIKMLLDFVKAGKRSL